MTQLQYYIFGCVIGYTIGYSFGKDDQRIQTNKHKHTSENLHYKICDYENFIKFKELTEEFNKYQKTPGQIKSIEKKNIAENDLLIKKTLTDLANDK